jgi:uncharacterized protein (TIGR03083 family)
MAAPTTTAEFCQALRTGRADWDTLLDQIGEERMTQPGAAGDWTIKDIVAHVTWHEREMLGVLRERALVGSDLWNLPLDERNAAIYNQNKDRPLDDVLKESRQVYPQLLELVESLSDEDLNDPSRFSDMPAEWPPRDLVGSNTFEHYADHVAAIRVWLGRTTKT